MVSDIEYLAVAPQIVYRCLMVCVRPQPIAESGPVTLIDVTDDLNRTISDLRGGATEGLASLTTAVG